MWSSREREKKMQFCSPVVVDGVLFKSLAYWPELCLKFLIMKYKLYLLELLFFTCVCVCVFVYVHSWMHAHTHTLCVCLCVSVMFVFGLLAGYFCLSAWNWKGFVLHCVLNDFLPCHVIVKETLQHGLGSNCSSGLSPADWSSVVFPLLLWQYLDANHIPQP